MRTEPRRALRAPMYEIYYLDGTSMTAGPRFRWREDVVRYLSERRGFADIGVRGPDGSWLRWDGTGLVGF